MNNTFKILCLFGIILVDRIVVKDIGMLSNRFKLPESLSLIIFPANDKAIKNMVNMDQAGTLCCTEVDFNRSNLKLNKPNKE